MFSLPVPVILSQKSVVKLRGTLSGSKIFTFLYFIEKSFKV